MDKDILFTIITIICYSIAATKKIFIISNFYKDLENITGMKILKKYKVPGTKNIIDIIGIHPTGIYIIKKIKYEGHVSGTLYMDYWEIGEEKNTHIIKNPINEMKANELIISDIIHKPIYPIIIFKNKTNCYVFDNWKDEHIRLIKEIDQYKIIKKTDDIIKDYESKEIFEKLRQKYI